MLKQADIVFQDGKFLVSGELCFANVMTIYRKSLPLLAVSPTFIFNFTQVTKSDSSGLALVIEWLKLAKKQGKAIRFESLSSELMAIAKAAGIEALITT